MRKRTFISGIGLVSAHGFGVDATWQALLEGKSGISPITQFDPAGFPSKVAGEVPSYKLRDYIPKHYRKAAKVMARDIQLAVIAAREAAAHAGLVTPAMDDSGSHGFYSPDRIGCQIGAGLIAADTDELTQALATATKDDGSFDIHKWGSEGMQQLTPLWMLKYLPNMLACHVTILHDLQGPSNTITCAEASSMLSLGESRRVIERGAADCCYCGGTASQLNPMAFIRQCFLGQLTSEDGDDAVRPFDAQASGSAVGEGGGILIIESEDTLKQRGGTAYSEILGFGASQSLNTNNRNNTPTTRGIQLAIGTALRDAGLTADHIDAVFANGTGNPELDASESEALSNLLGDKLSQTPVIATKASLGNTWAGAGAIDVGLASMALHTGTLPKPLNRTNPLPGFEAQSTAAPERILCLSSGTCGQNVAVILGKA